MISMDSYLNAYVDRRMKAIIGEWDLSTKDELDELEDRLAALEAGVPRLKESARVRSDKLAELEARAQRLNGRV